ncbi:helix-turn-helix domain-containing protein [Pendulispora brunnea]|uniref:Helix-turn-helix domain-containing protein n=1 Tax=Pendulispora brunnea TaxID=2905690 RepID=A0ABZ2K8Y8_9BACT
MERVGLVLYPGVGTFDFAVANEVWGDDRTDRGVPKFDLRRCALDLHPVKLDSGLACTPTHTLAGLAHGCDLIVVPGSGGSDHLPDARVLAALRKAHARGVSIASLCSGAFVLAEAGLLDGRSATTHWRLAPQLAERYPRVRVDPEALYIEDGVFTSAGTAAGIDLCLHLVRLAHGADVANTIARALVTAPFRAGGQAQFIDRRIEENDNSADRLSRLREYALQHLGEKLNVADLARRAAMSERTFARRFLATTGETPLQWLLHQRVLLAQRLLESTEMPIARVADECGFGSALSLRQHFSKVVGVSPADYRQSFRGKASPLP